MEGWQRGSSSTNGAPPDSRRSGRRRNSFPLTRPQRPGLGHAARAYLVRAKQRDRHSPPKHILLILPHRQSGPKISRSFRTRQTTSLLSSQWLNKTSHCQDPPQVASALWWSQSGRQSHRPSRDQHHHHNTHRDRQRSRASKLATAKRPQRVARSTPELSRDHISFSETTI